MNAAQMNQKTRRSIPAAPHPFPRRLGCWCCLHQGVGGRRLLSSLCASDPLTTEHDLCLVLTQITEYWRILLSIGCYETSVSRAYNAYNERETSRLLMSPPQAGAGHHLHTATVSCWGRRTRRLLLWMWEDTQAPPVAPLLTDIIKTNRSWRQT